MRRSTLITSMTAAVAPWMPQFGEFVSCFRPDNGRRELIAEVVWSALHGMAVLSESGRIPADGQQGRLDFLISRLGDDAGTAR